jgi:hypothetical protein
MRLLLQACHQQQLLLPQQLPLLRHRATLSWLADFGIAIVIGVTVGASDTAGVTVTAIAIG